MKRLKENKAMQNDLISCVTMVALGYLYIPDRWKKAAGAVWGLLFVLYVVLPLWKLYRDKHMTPEEKRELNRENNDERSQMIRNMAERHCWHLETVLLCIIFVVTVLWDQGNMDTVFSIVYLILVGRMCVTTAIRWWLEWKY